MSELSRREFLRTSAAATAGVGLTGAALQQPSASKSSNREQSAAISLPKGGGVINGIGESFQPSLFTGTCNFSVPIFTSAGRGSFGPQLTLQYSTGHGNGPFGLGWQLSIPRITRKTEKGLPAYTEDDVFVMSGSEDLVPYLDKASDTPEQWTPATLPLSGHIVTRYRPRTEGLFARIERWVKNGDPHDIHWRVTTKQNVTSVYGRSESARIVDPKTIGRIYEWLLEETFDANGNHIYYEYIQELNDAESLRLSDQYEQNRHFTQAYIRRILYGNPPDTLADDKGRYLPQREGLDHESRSSVALKSRRYVFEVLFDYGDLPESLPVYAENAYERSVPWWDPANDTLSKASLREDRFSSHRAGFEIRTLRLCNRVLMLHHFEEAALVGAPLVKSTHFTYGCDAHVKLSVLKAITVRGHRKGAAGSPRYVSREMPPVTFRYSEFEPAKQVYKPVIAEGNDYPPRALSDPNFMLLDIFGDGLPDIVQATRTGYYYWQNLGGARIDRRRRQATMPTGVLFSDRKVSVGDIGGDGLPDLIVDAPPMSGFYEATPDGRWKPFKRFDRRPSFDLADPNARLVDLTGDGLADMLVTQADHFLWFRCQGENGYAGPQAIPRNHNLDEFPDVHFNDATGRVRIADMSGDGLSDIVMVHDGRIEYWPSKGHGRWAGRIVMKDAPRLGFGFDPKRLFLVDLDGTGCADAVYVDFDRVHFWFNQSGNGFSPKHTIPGTPYTVDTTAVQFGDFFGTGTACLIWSSNYGYGRSNYKVLDFCGGRKPHLLVEMSNNMGATTRAQYAPSTKFYLADKKKGRPWVTNLPFPVHVVEKIEVTDHVSRTRLITRYIYHHGYYDGWEREFRGFGRVDQIDTEEFNSSSPVGRSETGMVFTNEQKPYHVPAVLTRNWFHTGIYFDEDAHTDHRDLSSKYRDEYYSPPDAIALAAHQLEVNTSPHQAYRALRGALLRSEVYALDSARNEDSPGIPYSVTENRYHVRQLQQSRRKPASPTEYFDGVFLTTVRESMSFHYERNPSDPRISHSLTLKVDDFGNVLRSVAVGYPRGTVPHRTPEQSQTHLALTVRRFANRDDQGEWRHIGLPVESRTYEVINPPEPRVRGSTVVPFLMEELLTAIGVLWPDTEMDPVAAKLLPYGNWDWRRQAVQRPPDMRLRLVEHVRTLYRMDDLTGLLQLGSIESRALPGNTYRLAFTGALLSQVYTRRRDGEVESLLGIPGDVLGGQGADRGGYVSSRDLKKSQCFPSSDPDDAWWSPGGTSFFSPHANVETPQETAAQELAEAREHFFLPRKYADPFGHASTVDYDGYDLLIAQTRDALDNRVTAVHDYRVLQPKQVTDANGNRVQVSFDSVGLVAGTAVMGRQDAGVGDNLDEFAADLAPSLVDGFLSQPHLHALDLLKGASTRVVYDVNRFRLSRAAHPDDPTKWTPAFAATLSRETHVSDRLPPQGLKIQISFSYSDGFGREIQKKIQAEPGSVPRRNDLGSIVVGTDGQPEMTGDTVKPRWIGNGWTVFNNKGNPVRQFEPFFTDTHLPDFDVHIGVSPVIFYDALQRVVAVLHPNRTYEKTVFDPWKRTIYDVNDTVDLDPRVDTDVKRYGEEFFATLPADWRPWLRAILADPQNPPSDTSGVDPTRDVAVRALKHAGTPNTTHFDSLGRPFLIVANNGKDTNGTPQTYETRLVLDVEANQREIIDAKSRVVMRYAYDMLANRIHQLSMEAGARWMLNDVTGKPIRAWDSRGHIFISAYDALRRPVSHTVRGTTASGDAASDPRTLNRDVLVEKIEYGEPPANASGADEDRAQRLNLRTRIYRRFDCAGIETNARLHPNGHPAAAYDFKGNLLYRTRQLIKDYTAIPDWLINQPLEDEYFEESTRYDALNRPIQWIAPHSSLAGAKCNVIQLVFAEASLLKRVDVWLQHAAEPLRILDPSTEAPSPVGVRNIDYDAKGQRLRIQHKNGASTSYQYDPQTFRLTHIYTRRGELFNDDCDNAQPPPPTIVAPETVPEGNACGLQNLHYTYDPAGNITHIHDKSQQTIYFRNQRVDPSTDYSYDALYRLIQASGREHLGQQTNGDRYRPTAPDAFTEFHARQNHPNVLAAMGAYIEQYVYDAVGNLLQMQHRGSDPANAGWSLGFSYAEPSLIEDGNGGTLLKTCNRLSATILNPNRANVPHGEPYLHDAHGNVARMPHLGGGLPGHNMHWDFKDQLRQTDLGGGGVTYYVYDASGQRVRKVWRKAPGLIEERIYLGAFEIFRKHGGPIGPNTATLERETLHVMEGKRRIALVETRTLDTAGSDQAATRLIRYQCDNHIGSSNLELDDEARIVSYEEYTPYGNVSYQAVRNQTEVPKRYRYTGQERDEENGFYYCGKRYYAAWIGRWTACDPIGLEAGLNLYAYGAANPVTFIDSTGAAPDEYQAQRRKDTAAKAGEIRQNLEHAKAQGYAPDPMQDRAARIKKETGRTPIEQHHHKGVKQAADVRLNPETMGDPMSSVWARKSTREDRTVQAGIGDKPVWDPEFRGKETHTHNVAAHLDLEEQGKGPKTAKGLEDAAVASKQRLPATADLAERAKKDWTPSPPKGPAVDPATGRVISEQATLGSRDLKLARAGGEAFEETRKGAAAFAKLGKAGRHLAAAVPILGIAVGQASVAHAASKGDYVGAALDEAGFIPVAGDLLDAARGGLALGEAANEFLVDQNRAMTHGEALKTAAQRIGAGETLSNMIGGLGAAGSAVMQVLMAVSL
jgi:RHS repeat-associated protein